MKKEEWKTIKGFPDYQISNLGRILSFKLNRKSKFLKLQPDYKRGYLKVKLYLGKKVYKFFSVHRLVALNFISNPNNKRTVNHKNGIKTDNRVENLEWMTYKENIQHSYDMNIRPPSFRRKFNAKQIKEIRLLKNKYSYYKIAKIYNAYEASIRRIILNKTYKDIK